MTAKTSVVIPYFQEEPGILRGAVVSAIAQVGMNDLEVIVVDDGSPVPAHRELQGLELPSHVALKILEQPNRGPGAARNRALDSLCAETAYLAFLDSDDRWTRSHLSSARGVLDNGYDFYFANHLLHDQNLDRFSKCDVDTCEHTCIDAQHRVFQFVGSITQNLLSESNVIHTSTVVFCRNKLNNIRFVESHWIGEDRLFWLRLLANCSRIAFSTSVACISSNGIHICQRSKWGSPKAVWSLYHDLGWRKWAADNLELGAIDKMVNQRALRKLKRDFASTLIHELRTLSAFRNPDILWFVMRTPSALLHVPSVAARTALNKARQRHAASRG